MIHIIHIFLAVNLFAAAFAGALHSELVRKVRHVSFFYFGLSLIGQILALPLLMVTIGSLIFALYRVQSSPVIALLNLVTLALFSLTLLRAWQGSKALSQVVPDGQNASFGRFLIGALFPFQLPRGDVKRIKDITYGPAGRKNQLDIYMPTTKPLLPMPVLVHIHGGGWVIGRKHQQAKPLIQHMASKGWLVVDVNYRLGPQNKMPAMIEDVLRAVSWAKANIDDYGGDPHFVALTGGSAGGHLVALAGLASGLESLKPGFELTDCSVDACVPVYGVYDFLKRNGASIDGIDELQSFLTRLVMPGPPEAHETLWKRVSPMSHIHQDAPPMLILHGRQDALVGFKSAKAFAQRLNQTSHNTVIFTGLPGGQHAYDMANAPPTPEHIRAVYRFLESVRAAKCAMKG
jgi:acetyl esterase/lipase